MLSRQTNGRTSHDSIVWTKHMYHAVKMYHSLAHITLKLKLAVAHH